MKKIGLIGGMGWESTAIYYQKINRMINAARGGQHTAKLHVSSLDFGEAYPLIRDRLHPELAALIEEDLRAQSNSGCEISLICCNTAHQALPYISDELRGGVVSIMNTVVDQALSMGFRHIAVLGTSSTLCSRLYDQPLQDVGISCVKPSAKESIRLDRIIFEELMFGLTRDESKTFAAELVERLALEGAEAVVLGCTELPMLIREGEVVLPILDSVDLHCQKAVAMALEA